MLFHKWNSYHPNLSGGAPSLYHERGVYRTQKGTLFGYIYDEIGYGRNRDGVTGAFTRTESAIVPFADAAEAVGWCEVEDVFEAADIEQHLPEGVEEA